MYLQYKTPNFNKLDGFIEHWSKFYNYKFEELYTNNIGKPITERSLYELYKWKNGSDLSFDKISSIEDNYPINFEGDYVDRYINPNKSGGCIWNIFYVHILNQKYPIFDQHTYRSMYYIKNNVICELPTNKSEVYNIYLNEYIPFINYINNPDYRKTDKALFMFGRFLKEASKYLSE